MARRLSLGFDVGTQSVKALLLDLDLGRVVDRASRPLELLSGLPEGAAEQHPEDWWQAVVACARELAGRAGIKGGELRGMAVSGQQHGLVTLDAAGRPVRPAKLWCDTSTAAEARELSERLGRPVPTGFTASKLLWLRRHEPQNRARVRTVLLPHDWINFRLTGERAMECGDASGTGFFDLPTRRFDPVAMAAIDPELEGWLPPLVPQDRALGRLGPEAARLMGLDAGIPVAAGSGDNMMSAIGAGAVEEGTLVLSLGTSGTAFLHSPRPFADPRGEIAGFCDATGGYLPLLCVMNMTGVTEDLRRFLGKDLDHERLTALAAASPPGSGGLVYLPYLVGERVPDLPHAAGLISGIRPGRLEAGNLYRAAIEGTSISMARGVDRLRELGARVDEVRIVGGAARNPVWRRTLATLLDRPIRVLAEAESAALGAAIQAAALDDAPGFDIAAWSRRCVAIDGPSEEPVPAWRPALLAARETFDRLVQAVHGLTDKRTTAG